MSEYKQKDLGYPRTPTTAKLLVEMPDGTTWSVPVQVIADSRDEYYRNYREDTVALFRTVRLNRFDIIDWATGSMNWRDVKPYAKKYAQRFIDPDYEDGWVTSEKSIQGDV